jgi:hypothetical protein
MERHRSWAPANPGQLLEHPAMSHSILTNSARALSLAVLLASGGTALAQTPNDIARSLWSQGNPAFAPMAAPAAYSAASGFTALDLARLTAAHGAAFSTSTATNGLFLVPSAAGPADLARLSGPSPRILPASSRAIRIANATHN